MLKIFDKKSIIASKNLASRNWLDSNFIFEHIAYDTFEKINELKGSFKNILIITSDAFEIFEKIKKFEYDNIFIVSEYIELLRLTNTNNTNQFKILSNFENLSLKDNNFDLIICNLCLHRINDVKSFIGKLKKLSSRDGLLICTYFGGKSLIELRNVLIKTDEIIKKKVYQRIIPFIDMIDATKLFQISGFQEVVTEKNVITIRYKNLIKLLFDIKNIGEINSLLSRCKGLISNNYFKTAEAIYKKNYLDNKKKLIATCEVISLVMWNNRTF